MTGLPRLEPFPFRWNRNAALGFCFDAFSPREPVSTSLENALTADFAADDGGEQFPLLVLEPHHLKLFDRIEIGRAGIDLDAGKQGVGREVLEARGLLH